MISITVACFFSQFQDSDIPKKNEKDISLDQIPADHRTIEYKKMDREGTKALEAILEFQASAHISRYVG